MSLGEDKTTWRRHLLVACIYLLGYYVFTFPALNTFWTHLLGDSGDTLQNYWNQWWIREAVWQGKWPWHTDMLFHPDGVTLIGATLNAFNGLVSVPLCLLFDPIPTYNILVVFSYVATGHFTFLLARHLWGGFWPPVFAGAAFTFSSYHLAHGIGHMQLISLEWLPFFLWTWLRFLNAPSHGRAVASAGSLFLVLLCDYYYVFYAVVAGALLFLHKSVQMRSAWFVRREALLPLISFVAACCLLCGYFVWGLLRESMMGKHESTHFMNDVFGPLVPGPNWRFHDLLQPYWFTDNRVEFTNHIGLSVLVLCAVTLWRSRRSELARQLRPWFWIGVLSYLLSLGPILQVWGNKFDVPMPYDLAEIVFPPLEMGGMPARMAVMYLLAAALIACAGLRHFWPKTSRPAWVIVLCVVFVVETLPLPQVTYKPGNWLFVQELAALPEGSVAGFKTTEAKALLFQTMHGKPMCNGYVARWPESTYNRALRFRQLRFEGRPLELLELSGCRYLVHERLAPSIVFHDGIEMIYSDADAAIYVRKDDPLAAVRGFDVNCRRPSTMKIVEERDPATGILTGLLLQAPDDVGCEFACGFSRTRGSIDLPGGHKLPLDKDDLFRHAYNPDNGYFIGSWGKIGRQGRSRIRINGGALYWLPIHEFWCCMVVRKRTDRDAVCRVEKPIYLELIKK